VTCRQHEGEAEATARNAPHQVSHRSHGFSGEDWKGRQARGTGVRIMGDDR
jgi:hypothetical protein